jgi:hypothetical protein
MDLADFPLSLERAVFLYLPLTSHLLHCYLLFMSNSLDRSVAHEDEQISRLALSLHPFGERCPS